MSADPFGLQRFVEAQADDYEDALAEIRDGEKQSHWMWYVFPQIAGLGHSEMARRYAIGSLDEARAYLAHPLLGPRLRTCVEAMNAHAGQDAREILGEVDAMKFRSCLTLFAQAAGPDPVFQRALVNFFHGHADVATLEELSRR